MQPFLELKNVSKVFPGVKALDSIDLEVYPGEIHGIIGENGAGKSTLIKILTGAHKNDSGQIFIEGKEVNINNPKDALNYGISAIYQELNTIPQLSIAENVFLGRQLKKHGNKGLLDITQMRKKSKELLNELGQEVDPTVKLSSLGIGKQQMVEIAKALSIKTRLLIMDEPTSSLTEKEVKDLFATIRGLKEKGITIIFISHRLEEVMKICDRVTVMRDGKKIDTLPIDKVNKNQLIKMMVGHSLDRQYPKVSTELGDEVLKVENLNRNGVFKNISFYVRRGEIVGFSGLVGSGRTEVMRAVFGADSYDSGEIYINGKKAKISCPRDAMNQGVAFLTEDRKGQGLILDNTIAFNTNIASFSKNSSGVFLDNKKLKEVAKDNINELSIKTPSENFIVRQLSGGNQQKTVIAKWLNTKANIYIFDEPTRGIDVGAKVEVCNIIGSLVENNCAIILISSELPEILGLCDRIYVMHEGKITAEINSADATQEKIMHAASGEV